MAFGFDVHVNGGTNDVTILATYNGQGVGKKVLEINGKLLALLSSNELRILLAPCPENSGYVFTLEGGEILSFLSDSVPDDKWASPGIVSIEQPPTCHSVIKFGLEVGSNGGIIPGNGRIRRSALVRTFFGE